MTIPDFELEPIFRVHSRDGYFYEVRPDQYGLGTIDLCYYEDHKDTKPKYVISMQREAAVLVLNALEKILKVTHDPS